MNINKYIDNNNFLRINQVVTTDERINIFASPKEYSYFDVDVRPGWIGRPYNTNESISTDGVTFAYQ